MTRSNAELFAGADKPDYSDRGEAGIATPMSWRTVSLAEHGTERNSNDPGLKWGSDVALVPVHQLLGYRALDRRGIHNRGDSTENISAIANDLKAKGVEGMKSPLYLLYNHEQKWAYLGEGHHRLEAAVQAGISHVPVHILRASSGEISEQKSRGLGAPLHLDNRVVEIGGYMPSYMHPGNFQEFEGAR